MLMMADNVAFGADIKQTFVRKFSRASSREKIAADIVARNSGGLIPIENFEQARSCWRGGSLPAARRTSFQGAGQSSRLSLALHCYVP
jgi:hypothetical protein